MCVCIYLCAYLCGMLISLWTVAVWLFDGLSDKLTLLNLTSGRPEGSNWEYWDIICPRFCLLSYVIEHSVLGWLFPKKNTKNPQNIRNKNTFYRDLHYKLMTIICYLCIIIIIHLLIVDNKKYSEKIYTM